MSAKATVENISTVQKRLNIEIPDDVVNKEFDHQFSIVQKKANLKGFRPGKAPLSMIRQLYTTYVTGDVINGLIGKSLESVLGDLKLNAVGTPVVEKMQDPKKDSPFVFSVIVDVMPDFKVENYKGIKIKVNKFEVKEEDTVEELQRISRRRGQATLVDREAEMGDLVKYSQKVTDASGIPVTALTFKNTAALLGAHETAPEVEAMLLGMKASETKEQTINMPKDFKNSELAGEGLNFTITLTEVHSFMLPEVNDELAKDLSFDSLEDLKKDIRTRITSSFEKSNQDFKEQAVMNDLLARNTFEVPPTMVDSAIDTMINESQIPDKKELEKIKKDPSVRASLLEKAQSRVKTSLILWQIKNQEKLEVTDDDVKNYYRKMFPADEYEQNQDLIEKLMVKNADALKNELIFSKAIELVVENAIIETV